MKKLKPDCAVIGSGPAGLAAALAAWDSGLKKVVLIERDLELGGILPQCIHDGFGSIVFKETLTGPEYAQRFIDRLTSTGVEVLLDTMVLDLAADRKISAVSAANGVVELEPKTVILAMGCRERTRHNILIPGFRPAGVITAGLAQRWINIEGLMPGRRVVVLGSGDIGMIMARRFCLEGAEVEGVYELMDHPGGLTRNRVQCLDNFDIPLHLAHTVTFIHGRKRVTGVSVAAVDEARKPVAATERFIPCDTLMLSVGLIPENELSRKAGVQLDEITGGPVVDDTMHTSVPGIFACGNVVNVYDLVDYVTQTAETAGRGAAAWVQAGGPEPQPRIRVLPGRNVSYVVPQYVTSLEREVSFYFRVEHPEKAVVARVSADGEELARKKAKMVRPPEMVRARAKAREWAAGSDVEEIVVDVVATDEEIEGAGDE